MQPMYYIGLDVHKRKISYCVKDGSGRIHSEGLDFRHTSGPGPLDAIASAAVERGDGGDHVHRLDLLITSSRMRPC